MNAQSNHHPISETTRHIIDQLIAHGLKLGHDYPIEFAFFGSKEELEHLRAHLLNAGFEEDTTQSAEMLVVKKDTQLDYEAIGTALAEMNEIAKRFGVGFDGWSSAVN